MVRSEAKSGASISNCAPRCRHSRRHQTQRLQQTAGHAQKTNLQRQGKLEGRRSALVINDVAFRLGIRKERFDLKAAQVTRQHALDPDTWTASRSCSASRCAPQYAPRNSEQQVFDRLGKRGVSRFNYRDKVAAPLARKSRGPRFGEPSRRGLRQCFTEPFLTRNSDCCSSLV